MPNSLTPTILRLPAVKARTGLSRSTIYVMIAEGRFPVGVRLGTQAVGWYDSEVAEWIATRARANKATAE